MLWHVISEYKAHIAAYDREEEIDNLKEQLIFFKNGYQAQTEAQAETQAQAEAQAQASFPVPLTVNID